MCGGFTCSKNALISLNIFYVIVSFILIGVASYAKASSLLPSIPIVGGIIACGIFLLLIAFIGLIGALKHHQVLLFFYMIVLFLLFIIQFSVACACLAVNEEQRRDIMTSAWPHLDSGTMETIQVEGECCGMVLNNGTWSANIETCAKACKIDPDAGNCNITNTDTGEITCGDCRRSCDKELEPLMEHAFRASGGIGLFFSFTEIAGFALAYRYRNMIDPQSNIQTLP